MYKDAECCRVRKGPQVLPAARVGDKRRDAGLVLDRVFSLTCSEDYLVSGLGCDAAIVVTPQVQAEWARPYEDAYAYEEGTSRRRAGGHQAPEIRRRQSQPGPGNVKIAVKS